VFLFPYIFLFSIKENKLLWGFPTCLFLHKKYILGALAARLPPRNAAGKQLAGCLHRLLVPNKARSWAAREPAA